MTKPNCRVVYNQDCTNLFGITKEPMEPRHVLRMVDEVADGGADAFLVNPNAQKVAYPSRVWPTFWDGFTPGDRAWFGDVPDKEVEGRAHFVSQMKRLADHGHDYMTLALDRCRQRGLVPGVTVRMNDMHDIPWPGSHIFSQFYCEHPEAHLAEQSHGGWGGTGLNYEHAAVRDHYLALIRELLERYNFELLELDFLRFTCYFPRPVTDDRCRIMTAFLRTVRDLCARSGRSIRLVPRVPSTPALAREMGLDVAAWAREGLIDGLTVGAFLNTDWQMPVEAFRERLGPAIPLHVSTDFAADRREGLPVRHLPVDPEVLRGFAAAYLAAGADGINIFNFFCTRESTPSREPSFQTLGELKSLTGLRGRPKKYLLTSGTSSLDADEPVQVPVEFVGHQSRQFHMLLAAEPFDTPIQAAVAFEGQAGKDQLWLQANHEPVGCAREVRDLPDKESAKAAIFSIPASLLCDGRNYLVLRSEAEKVTMITLEVHVGKI